MRLQSCCTRCPDYIFHLAAQSSVSVAWKNPGLTIDINVKGSEPDGCESELFYNRGCLIGSGSSTAISGKRETPIKEDNYSSGQYLCGNKGMPEYDCRIHGTQAYDMQLMMVRAFNHIGPCQRTNLCDFRFRASRVADRGGKENRSCMSELAVRFYDVTLCVCTSWCRKEPERLLQCRQRMMPMRSEILDLDYFIFSGGRFGEIDPRIRSARWITDY